MTMIAVSILLLFDNYYDYDCNYKNHLEYYYKYFNYYNL